MPDALFEELVSGPAGEPLVVLVRLASALALGGVVALIYRKTRGTAAQPSFVATLVLLSVLIAMVTQIIGDSLARAFGLVGALSIVRFRTVVRDTQDTAYVIFAVAVGMAAGAGVYWVAVAGIGIVAIAALLLRRGAEAERPAALTFDLEARVGVGTDRALLAPALDEHTTEHRLMSIATGQKGLAVDLTFVGSLRTDESADALVKALNRIDGVQSVTLRRRAADDEGWRSS